MDKKRTFNIFLIVFIDLLGFGLILPLLPYYADSYGASPGVIGLLSASYAAAQLIGAPWLGRLSDRYGRRPILIISIFGTFLSLLLLGSAEYLGKLIAELISNGTATTLLINTCVIFLLFTSRIMDGLTGGNISVAQAYITDITDESNRASGLGLIGAAFGLGFIFGPAIGGLLSTWGYALPAFVAAGLAGINLISVILALPESLPEKARQDIQTRSFTMKHLQEALKRPRVGPLLNIRFFYGLAWSLFQSIFPLFALYQLNLNSQQTGFVLTYVGILAAFVQGYLVGKLVVKYQEKNLIFIGAIVLLFAFFAWAFTPSVLYLIFILAPIAFAAGILNTLLNSSLTKVVYPEEVGGILGISASVESSTRVIAPSIGGFMLGQIGTWSPGLLSSLIMVWVVTYTYKRLILNPDPPLPAREPQYLSTSDGLSTD